jgi:hypothetical protein
VGKFLGKWLRDQKLLSMVKIKDENRRIPGQLRRNARLSQVLVGRLEDARRVRRRHPPDPGFTAGYCYGSRADYIESNTMPA